MHFTVNDILYWKEDGSVLPRQRILDGRNRFAVGKKGKEDNWFGFLHVKFENLGLGCQTVMGRVNKFLWENTLSSSVS